MSNTMFMLLLALCLVACSSAPVSNPALQNSNPTSPSTEPVDDEEAIRQLLQAESEGVVNRDIERLATLWAEDAIVRDAHHTPDDESDDAVWRGIDAILDRYVVLVFPGNPQFAAPGDLEIVIDGDRAQIRSTTQIGDEISPGGDLWTMSHQNGQWQLQSLIYNLEPNLKS